MELITNTMIQIVRVAARHARAMGWNASGINFINSSILFFILCYHIQSLEGQISTGVCIIIQCDI